ncbi:hypothetical protein HYH02_015073 [Chlamydomonas schloesseri]|uniref:Uncharacterized protein n=1 Tax=Chlamydomonas schloesseri TaxID=2026947 RepID=A0A835VTP3_9CHLO|nr:hypothetical protein HYH02_015073 [Chlamydomonas schloesseri]|eukprot:KAG2425129.1 hypothetical protein HYH02_015073 [Chlamydomonas schloesseri]
MATVMLSKPCAVLLGNASTRRSPLAFSSGSSTRALRAVAPRPAPAGPTSSGRAVALVVRASNEEKQVVYNKEFGYSRKDVILIGVGLIALGYALYYGLQAGGMEPGMAGNWVQLIIFMGICVGWVSTYIFRVATKQMTYVKQLEQYEEAVMRKRVEEMTEAELEQLATEVDTDKQRKSAARGGAPQQ